MKSIGWFTISNTTFPTSYIYHRHRKSDSSFSKSIHNQYFDLRPLGYGRSKSYFGKEDFDDINSKSKRENYPFDDPEPTEKGSDSGLLSDMAMADDIYENYHNLLSISNRKDVHNSPFTDYQNFLSTIDSEDSNYQWSRLAAEILKRSDRSADFIGHKIEHISKKQRPRAGKRRKNSHASFIK